MHLPPLQSPFSASYHVSGEVAIAPDAVIAPGVVLMADPESSIVVGAGACLGLGVVLHSHQGRIVVEPGASLGAGVLVVGNCRVGTHACVGASTTLHNASVPPGQLVPPGSMVGQAGQAQSPQSTVSSGDFGSGVSSQASRPEGEEPSPWDEESGGSDSPSSSAKPPRMEEDGADASATFTNDEPPSSDAAPKQPKKIYGKEQFERMRTLFMPDQTV